MPPNADRPSYYHHPGDRPLLGTTIDAYVRQVVERHRSREAIVSIPQAVRLTYGDLDDRVDALACALIGLEVEAGDRVAIWSTDNIEWVLLQLAAARVGAILVNINPAYRERELAHALRRAKVQTLVLIPRFRSSDYVEMVRAVCPEASTAAPDALRSAGLPDLRHLVVYDPESATGATAPGGAFMTWAQLLERGRGVSVEDVRRRAAAGDPDDPINIQFTSGTTGLPKAVVLTHHGILNNAFFVGEAMGMTEADRLCVPVPFYHCFGMVVATLACLTHGSTIVIPAPHFEAGATLAAIERERCTVLHGVPTMFVAELERPDFAQYDLSSLRTGIMGGAPCPPALVRRVIEELGCREIVVAYGMTESSPITHVTRRDDPPDRRASTVGSNMPHQEVKIVDPATGAIAPRGATGEICFRGYNLMRGYLDDEAATRAAIDEAGWLHSGDLGVMEEDGYLRITGRLKDMIIRGGENVYPAEIEAFYVEHPKIADIAVFGYADPFLGEEVGAWVALHEGQHAEPDELRAWAKGRIAHFKIPKRIWIVDTFPMTTSGKVQKFRIREIVERELAAEPEPARSS